MGRDTMDEGPSGIALDHEFALSRLAARLKLAEADVLRMMFDLVQRVRPRLRER